MYFSWIYIRNGNFGHHDYEIFSLSRYCQIVSQHGCKIDPPNSSVGEFWFLHILSTLGIFSVLAVLMLCIERGFLIFVNFLIYFFWEGELFHSLSGQMARVGRAGGLGAGSWQCHPQQNWAMSPRQNVWRGWELGTCAAGECSTGRGWNPCGETGS